jgi:hypothetical protein
VTEQFQTPIEIAYTEVKSISPKDTKMTTHCPGGVKETKLFGTVNILLL